MIESIEFTNFKALRKTTLPLAPFTLLLGPNGSGKTSVLQALQDIAALSALPAAQARGPVAAQIGQSWSSIRSITARDSEEPLSISLRMRKQNQPVIATFGQKAKEVVITRQFSYEDNNPLPDIHARPLIQWLGRVQTYALDPNAIARPVVVGSGPLQRDGTGLAAVLDDLKDNAPERWESLLDEMRRWIPEYDYIQFDYPVKGQKGIVLRTKRAGHRIPASELSQGTLVALALLALVYLPTPPSLVGLEEIDRGLHPRLLRHLQDALYRLAYPESCGESRPPVQVIATTHSPYLLDLFRDHPEEVVLARKEELEVTMQRLTDIEHFQEILGESPLSEVWYSGVLGGVSVKP